MQSRAKFLGHSIHVILIVFPLGLLATAVIFDLIYLIWGNRTLIPVAYWMIAAGIVGGLVAAPFGLIDWLAIPRPTRARSIGLIHGLGNVVVLALFAASWWFRGDPRVSPSVPALVLSYTGAGIAMITGWLGGELVERLGMSVDDHANLNAPSSLFHVAADRR